MQPVPRIFVSATSRDLRTARGLVSEGLRRMECLPIVQDDFPPDYKSVRDMLRTKLETCNAVVHLAGFYYGAEPQPVLPGPDRRSFTQMEYEIAMELKLPCYVFLCGKDFPFDTHDPEPEDKQQLQIAHRERLLKRDELFYEFASPEELSTRTRELQLSVEGLRKELESERTRRRLAMIAAAAALFIAIVGGIWLSTRAAKQEAVNVEQTSEIAALKAQLEGPWIIVNKVNAATELLRQRSKGSTEEEIKSAAIQIVAADVKKTPEEVKVAIDSATQVAEKLLVAARKEGQGDAKQTDASRLLESDTLIKLAASHAAAANYKAALDNYEKAFALLDPKTQPEVWMSTLTSIALMQEELGLKEQAVANYKKAIAFGESTPSIGLGHETTLYATSNLIYNLRYVTKDVPTAEDTMRRILKERESTLGVDDYTTLLAKGELAEILSSQKKYDEATALSLKALKQSEQLFGKNEEVTIDIMGNLANVYDDQGETGKAIDLNRQVLAFREEALAADDPYLLSWQDILANMLERNGEIDEARQIYEKILSTREKSLGAEHPDTLGSKQTLADLYGREENFAKAKKMTEQVLAQREKVLGPDDPATLESVDGLALQLSNLKDDAGAEKLYHRILDAKERANASGDDLAIETNANLAQILMDKEDFAGAEKYYRIALAGREKTMDADDPDLADTYYRLAYVLCSQEKNAEALPLAKRAVAIGKKTLPANDENLAAYKELVEDASP